ncbi:beta-2-microglobulin-like [Kryptolebias marmoratus]|uniref:Beta-2-microglobulin n=1 Tax=Kryptolebias marmoratus TaxID=37003 RepID=A0A3Q3BKS8_KRYMA|nr:beta-2-microglobulin-like [Kryptolebias marmoratus]
MKELLFLVFFCYVSHFVSSKTASPAVQVYSRNQGVYDKENVFICHVTGFYPPEITIVLLRNGEEIPGSKQTDLAFDDHWHYHLTKHVPFTPKAGEKYSCRVTHNKKTVSYMWEADV